uniref:hypothetical protein n=1 Tax=Pseudomonas syringae TaxID=317 RepID=UPI0013313429|nr:hypothetical protein [Pseudomonas syringae]
MKSVKASDHAKQSLHLRDKTSSLNPADRELFLQQLASHDIQIDEATIAAAECAERECRSAIAQSEL